MTPETRPPGHPPYPQPPRPSPGYAVPPAGHPAPHYYAGGPAPDGRRQLNVVGLIGAVLAAAALLVSFVPYVGMLAILLAVVSGILGLAGLGVWLSARRHDWIWPTAALLLTAAAVGMSVVQFGRTVEAVSTAITPAPPPPTQQQAVAVPGGPVPGADAWVGTGPDRATSARYAAQQGTLRVHVKAAKVLTGRYTPPGNVFSKGSEPPVTGPYLHVTLVASNVGPAGSGIVNLDGFAPVFKQDGGELRTVRPDAPAADPIQLKTGLLSGGRAELHYYVTDPNPASPVLVEIPAGSSGRPGHMRLSISAGDVRR